MNREYERRHGVSHDKLRGQNDFYVHSREVAEAVRQNDRHVIAAGVPVQFEETVPTIDGERRYISSKFLLRDRKGCPYAVCGIATDITELKRAEALHVGRARQAALHAGIQLAFSEAPERDLPMVLQACAEVVVRHFETAIARVWTLEEKEKTCWHCEPVQANAHTPTTARAAQLTNDLQGDPDNRNPKSGPAKKEFEHSPDTR